MATYSKKLIAEDTDGLERLPNRPVGHDLTSALISHYDNHDNNSNWRTSISEQAIAKHSSGRSEGLDETQLLVSRFMMMLGLAFVLCGFPSYSNAALALPLYYDFNEGSGTFAINKGNAINANGTINGAVYEPDTNRTGIGSVMSFGGNGDHISVPDSFSYFNFVTVEAWINPDAVDGQRIIWDDYGSPGVLLAIVGGQLQFAISTAANPGMGVGVVGGVVCTGKWQHVAGTYDGATAKAFVNGVEVASAPTSGTIIGNGAGIAAAIGSDNQSTNALNFAGKIDNFYLWNDRALPASFLGDGQANTGASCSSGENLPPIANAGDDQYVDHAKPLPNIELDGSGSFDPDGLPATLTYRWTGPKTVTLVGANTATSSFTPPSFGKYSFSLVVNDGASDSKPDLVNISVFDSSGLNSCVSGCDNISCPLDSASCYYNCHVIFPGLRNSSSLDVVQRATFNLTAFQQTYRDVHDRLLAATPEGQRLIQLFNSHRAELLTLGIANPALVEKIFTEQRMAKPLFDALLAGNGDKVIITAGQIQAVEEILNDFVAIASPALQQDIAAERKRLGNLNTYVGKTMSQAQTKILGHGLFLPRLSNP